MTYTPSPEEIDNLYEKLDREAAAGGYNLNPDEEFTRDLVEALLTNTRRYGYPSCPCRLTEGTREQDLDIICPCDYRDPDLSEYGSCYCALYVSDGIVRGEKEAEPIPERRKKPSDKKVSFEGERRRMGKGETLRQAQGKAIRDLPYPVWRCPVCGYLCARKHPPEKCPICKADGDRFGRFL